MEGDPRVGFTVIDNSGEAGEVRPSLEGEAAWTSCGSRQLSDVEVERLGREADALVAEKFRSRRDLGPDLSRFRRRTLEAVPAPQQSSVVSRSQSVTTLQ